MLVKYVISWLKSVVDTYKEILPNYFYHLDRYFE